MKRKWKWVGRKKKTERKSKSSSEAKRRKSKGVKAKLNKKNRTVDEKEGKDIQQKWMQVKKEGCYI